MDLMDLDDLVLLARPGCGVHHGGRGTDLFQRLVFASIIVPFTCYLLKWNDQGRCMHGPDGPRRLSAFGLAKGLVFIMVAMDLVFERLVYAPWLVISSN